MNYESVPSVNELYDQAKTLSRRMPELSEPKNETVKSILENMDAILGDLRCELDMIEAAIFSPRPTNSGEACQEKTKECMLGTLDRHRNEAESLLVTVRRIRDGLW